MIQLPGDWAARPMFRTTLPDGRSAIRIETVPDSDPKAIDGHKIAPVAAILKFLSACSIRVPEVYEADAEAGVLVLEDFGDDSWGRVLPDHQSDFYPQAVNVLKQFQTLAPRPDAPLPDFACSYIFGRTAWFLDDYKQNKDPQKRRAFMQVWDTLLEELHHEPVHFVHGDFHPGNLMRLINGTMGVLDVGGAFWGCGIYDLVNLLEDIRRDVPDDVKVAMKKVYGGNETSYAILHVQFYMRLLGQMTRRGMDIPTKLPYAIEKLIHRHSVLAPLKPLVLD